MVHVFDKGFLGWGPQPVNQQRRFTDILRQFQEEGDIMIIMIIITAL